MTNLLPAPGETRLAETEAREAKDDLVGHLRWVQTHEPDAQRASRAGRHADGIDEWFALFVTRPHAPADWRHLSAVYRRERARLAWPERAAGDSMGSTELA